MQISIEVHNYMETLVGAHLAEDEYTSKYDHEQLADLACLSLNQLRPVYIRYDIDFLSRLPEGKLMQFQAQVSDAVIAAETMISDDRRRERIEEEIIMADDDNEGDDRELEWYEQPILSKKP